MTVLAAPSATIATTYPAEPATPANSALTIAMVATIAPSHGPSRPSRPVHVDQAPTGQLLRQRECLPAGHPDRAKLRNQAIETNLPVARRLARRYGGRGESLDDLTQVAALALVKAVDGYDSSRSVAFASYAVPASSAPSNVISATPPGEFGCRAVPRN